MKKVVGISLQEVGKVYWFNQGRLLLTKNMKVIVETIRGLEIGTVIQETRDVEDNFIEHELKDVIRIATAQDISTQKENEEKALQVMKRVKEIISEYKLDMKTIGCEYTLDGSKLLIYYNAEGRVDFRELVKSLAGEFRVRIELRQIGQREGAKILGGLGCCGIEVCCKTHLREFDLVSMKMAKDQGMALSSNKIAGICGKLLCCIAYENEAYEQLRKKVPGVGEYVSTPNCKKCRVINADYLKEKVKTDNEGTIEEWEASQVLRLKPVKGKNDSNKGNETEK